MTQDIPAAGMDFDARRRELKTALAAAETRGDTDTTEDLREELDQMVATQQREVAAAARKAAADASSDPDDARKTAPAGRTATPAKATAKQVDAGKGGQAADAGKQ